MSLYANIRGIADSELPVETRSRGIAFATGLFLGVKVANAASFTPGNQLSKLWLEQGFQYTNRTISEINETILLDVKYASQIAQSVFNMIGSVKTEPVRLAVDKTADVQTSLLGMLFDTHGFLTEADLHFFKEHHNGITAIYSLLQQEEASAGA